MDFENFEVDISSLPDYERVTYHSISKKYLVIVLFNLVVFSAALLIALYVFNTIQPKFFGGYYLYFFGSLSTFLILNIVLSTLSFFTKKYAVRSHDVIYRSGLIKNSTVIIPFNRIQHVDLEEGWLSRLFNLKSIVVYTAGQRGGDISINGLEGDLSHKIKELILNKIKTDPDVIDSVETTDVFQDEK